MNKLRWGKFFWSDWADDPALALCSHTAQSVWMRLMCIAAQGTPYGHVTINGKAPSIEDLANLVRPRLRLRDFRRAIEELERNGVATRGACGCLVSRRMERDGHIVEARREAAEKSWSGSRQRPHSDHAATTQRPRSDHSLDHRKPANPLKNGKTVDGLHMQNSSFAFTESTEAESERARDACLSKQLQSARAVKDPPKSSRKREDLPNPSHAAAAASAPLGRAAATRGSLRVVVNREEDDGTERLDR